MKTPHFLIITLLLLFDHRILPAQYQQIEWSAYFGGNADEYAEEIAVDFEGNILVAGKTKSASGIATPNAYQNNYGGGGSDAFLAKFNHLGKLLWATYFGGPGTEYAYAVTVDLNGNIYIGGGTTSSSGIATAGALQTFKAGSTDGFLAKFDRNGALNWATYFGGPWGEWVLSIATDKDLNVYFTGYTGSSDGIATADAYQEEYAGAMDCYLTKLGQEGNLLFSTYFGGSGEDRPHDVHIDHNGDIILNGTTPSDGLSTPGVHQEVRGGSVDAFVSKWTADGQLIWSSYYGGATSDRGRECVTDEDGNIYLTGFTTSTTKIATPGSHQETISLDEAGRPSQESYLVKFNASGLREWGTYLGGAGSEYGRGVKISLSGNVLISGVTGSKSNIATPDGFQPQKGGASDSYLAEFTPDGELVGSTYYGGSEAEPYDIGYGPAIDLDVQGNVYLAPTSKSPDLPNTLNNLAGGYDAVLTKFISSPHRLVMATEQQMEPGIEIYPNPVNTVAIMRFHAAAEGEIKLNVFDVIGGYVLSKQVFANAGINEIRIDVRDWSPGVYFLSVPGVTGESNLKIAVQH